MLEHRNHKPWSCARWFRLILLWAGSLAVTSCWGQEVILYLRNGDRVTGTVVSTNNNAVIVATSYAGRITISASQVERRENAPSRSAAIADSPAKISGVQPPQPTASSPAQAFSSGKTNPPNTLVVAKTAPPRSAESKTNQPSDLRKFLSAWKGELELGLNLGYSTKERQMYAGRFKASHLYTTRGQRLLKNDLDYLVSYGRTDGVLSDNRMDGSWKAQYTIGKRLSIYEATGAGYDEIRKINLRYDVGPGVGYKWLNRTNFVLLTELGGNYQEQFFANDTRKSRYSLRVAEESWWQAASKLRLDEKIEFFPEINKFGDYRLRAESNLSYLFHGNLALKLTVIDLYETDPAKDVSNNDLQIRSSISIRF